MAHYARDKPQQSDRAMSLEVDKNRWDFLQKLVAIEEKHDKKQEERRKELEREKALEVREKTKQDAATKLNDTNDSLSRWLYSQVLDDNPEDNQMEDSLFTTEVLKRTTGLSNISDCEYESPCTPHSLTLETRSWVSLPSLCSTASCHEDEPGSPIPRKKRQLRLPPILLPKIYTVTPRPLQYREFLTPTTVRGPITDEEWEELKYCRYIRQGVPKFTVQLSSSSLSSNMRL
nr:hypothetical protein BgiMline_011313 [Biomphalaria glabrata]